jgi:hypothetical protein
VQLEPVVVGSAAADAVSYSFISADSDLGGVEFTDSTSTGWAELEAFLTANAESYSDVSTDIEDNEVEAVSLSGVWAELEAFLTADAESYSDVSTDIEDNEVEAVSLSGVWADLEAFLTADAESYSDVSTDIEDNEVEAVSLSGVWADLEAFLTADAESYSDVSTDMEDNEAEAVSLSGVWADLEAFLTADAESYSDASTASDDPLAPAVSLSGVWADLEAFLTADAESYSDVSTDIEDNEAEAVSLSGVWADLEAFLTADAESYSDVSTDMEDNEVEAVSLSGVWADLEAFLTADAESYSDVSTDMEDNEVEAVSLSGVWADLEAFLAADAESHSDVSTDMEDNEVEAVSLSGVWAGIVPLLSAEATSFSVGLFSPSSDAGSETISLSSFDAAIVPLQNADRVSFSYGISDADTEVDSESTSYSIAEATLDVMASPPPQITGWVENYGTTAVLPPHKVGDLILVWAGSAGTNVAGTPAMPAAVGTVPAFTSGPVANSVAASGTSRGMRFAWAKATRTDHTLGTWTGAAVLDVAIVTNVADVPVGDIKVAAAAETRTTGQTFNNVTPALVMQHLDGRSMVIRALSGGGVQLGGGIPPPQPSYAWTPPVGYTQEFNKFAGASGFYAASRVEATEAPAANLSARLTITGGASISVSEQLSSVEVIGNPRPGITDMTETVSLTAPGGHVVTVPDWASEFDVVALGGGGGGGQGIGPFIAAQGGAAGKWAARRFFRADLGASKTFVVQVGFGGRGGDNPPETLIVAIAQPGTQSSAAVNGVLVSAAGGNGAQSGSQWGGNPPSYIFNGVTYIGGSTAQISGAQGGSPGAGGSGSSGPLLGIGGFGGNGGNGRVWIRFRGAARNLEGPLEHPVVKRMT